MERYAPNKMELASRDVVSRAEQTEIDEGRGLPRRHRRPGHHRGPAQANPRGAPRDRSRRSRLRRRRHHPRADPHQAGQPLHDGRGPHRRPRRDLGPRPLRGGRGGLRLRARRQPAGRQLAARHPDLRPPLRRARRRPRQDPCAQPPAPSPPWPARTSASTRSWPAAPTTAAAEWPRSATRWASTMDRYVGVFRDAEGIQAALDVVEAPAGGGQGASTSTTTGRLQPGPARRDRARIHARQRGVHLRRRASPHREPRRAHTAPTSRSETTRSGSSTST